MSGADDRLAAEIAEAERMRAEGVADFNRLRLPRSTPPGLSETARADADEALRDFERRLATGDWYGHDDEEANDG